MKDWNLQLECETVMHDCLIVPVLIFVNEKERPMVRVLRMENIRGLLGIRSAERILNTQVRVVWCEVDE